MSRLLFAAARGARIEVLYQRVWITLTHISIVPNKHAYRIHSDDAHLQYGPISTALRDMAINDLWYPPSWQISLASTVSLDVAREFSELLFSRRENEDYPLFYLFLAEFLADEGM